MSGICHGGDIGLFIPVEEPFISGVIRDSRLVRSNVI
jgi:hypothetical protein